MSPFEIIILSIGLGMDAFSVSVCKGLCMPKMDWKKAGIIGGYFGFFQALMPVIGYFLGIRFENYIKSFDHWIAFILLTFLGIKMIKDIYKKEETSSNDSIDIKTMLLLAIATSIDALTVGVTLAFLNVSIFTSAISIGIITFLLSMIGVKIGNIFGDKYEKSAQLVGGIILILIGTKILFEHLKIFTNFF